MAGMNILWKHNAKADVAPDHYFGSIYCDYVWYSF
jgi:hypothetical protein